MAGRRDDPWRWAEGARQRLLEMSAREVVTDVQALLVAHPELADALHPFLLKWQARVDTASTAWNYLERGAGAPHAK